MAFNLFWYDRPDKAYTNESKIVLSALPTNHGLEPVLSSTIEVAVVVSNVRKVFDWNGTRVHLDDVESLGSFLEFEQTLSREDSTSSANAELRAMLEQLEIPFDALQAGSYSDLLLLRSPTSS